MTELMDEAGTRLALCSRTEPAAESTVLCTRVHLTRQDNTCLPPTVASRRVPLVECVRFELCSAFKYAARVECSSSDAYAMPMRSMQRGDVESAVYERIGSDLIGFAFAFALIVACRMRRQVWMCCAVLYVIQYIQYSA